MTLGQPAHAAMISHFGCTGAPNTRSGSTLFECYAGAKNQRGLNRDPIQWERAHCDRKYLRACNA